MAKHPYERYPETYIRLLQWIRAFAESHEGNRLPSEEHIAAQLGVSRVKIRDVFSQLEAAGYITRKRGVGTLLNRYVLAEAGRLDIDSIYVEIISKYGYHPHSATHKLKLIQQPARVLQEKLGLQPGDSVYLFEKVVYADDQPLILVEDYLPAHLYESVSCDLTLLDTNIYFFLQSMCDDLLQTATVHLDTFAADERLAKLMQVEPGFPFLKLDTVFYTQSAASVLYSVEYYNTKKIPFSFQKRILSGKFDRNQPPETLE